MAKKIAQVSNLQFDIFLFTFYKFFAFLWFTIWLFLGYKCSEENNCNGHGICRDNTWCLCRPGWSSKEDCSGIFIFRKIFENEVEFFLTQSPVSSKVRLSRSPECFLASDDLHLSFILTFSCP